MTKVGLCMGLKMAHELRKNKPCELNLSGKDTQKLYG